MTHLQNLKIDSYLKYGSIHVDHIDHIMLAQF